VDSSSLQSLTIPDCGCEDKEHLDLVHCRIPSAKNVVWHLEGREGGERKEEKQRREKKGYVRCVTLGK
jgi:hypothetical protein